MAAPGAIAHRIHKVRGDLKAEMGGRLCGIWIVYSSKILEVINVSSMEERLIKHIM